MSEETKFKHNLKYHFMVGYESLNINDIKLVYGYPSCLVPNYDFIEYAIEALIDLSQRIRPVNLDFSKKELLYIKSMIFNGAASIGFKEQELLRRKIDSMIENYDDDK